VRRALAIVYDAIDARVTAIAARGWPCRRGCDACCKSLAEAPRITRAEWDVLREGIDAREDRDEVLARLRALPREGRVACPLLDDARGECTVYAHRPAACRAYGFYAARDGGRHCAIVERAADDAVVWGNHDALDRSLVAISGEARSIVDWARG